MKIKDGFMLRKVGGQNVVVAVGKASLEFNGIIRLNETGKFLWEQLKADITEEQLITLKGIALILDASFRKL